MSQTNTLELPDTVYDALLAAARARDTTPAEWIAGHLPHEPQSAPEQERLVANRRLREHTISSGRATSSDNASIDADLMAQYGE